MKKESKRVNLPSDEFPHDNQAIEWWYFNGFLENKKNKYAFMTTLFKADKEKINFSFLKTPMKEVYFSHTLLYDLVKKTVKKEILPVVLISEDSFKEKELFINYFYPARKDFCVYEIARYKDNLRLKTRFFDLYAKALKKPMLEGGKGYLDLGEKTTFYYSYPRLKIKGKVEGEKVKGIGWHDKQWSPQGFMKDEWLWFSFQLPNGTDIVCFDYKGKKMATISHRNNKQETVNVSFKPIGKPWKNKRSGNSYHLSWEIRIKNMIIRTRPIIKSCEMIFGTIDYWEGPIEVICSGKKSNGFMELLSKQKEQKFTDKIFAFEHEIKNIIKLWDKTKTS